MDNIIFTPIPFEELVEAISFKVLEIISKKELLIPINLPRDTNEYLTREETAQMCKVKSLTTLWNWEQSGKLIPRMRAGKKPLYHQEDINAFLKRMDSG